jgi:hypothetical protein
MDPQTPQDKEVDFTHYLESQKKEQKVEEVIDVPKPRKVRVRQIILLIIAIALAGTLWYLLSQNKISSQTSAPPGFRIVQPATGPPKLERIDQ